MNESPRAFRFPLVVAVFLAVMAGVLSGGALLWRARRQALEARAETLAQAAAKTVPTCVLNDDLGCTVGATAKHFENLGVRQGVVAGLVMFDGQQATLFEMVPRDTSLEPLLIEGAREKVNRRKGRFYVASASVEITLQDLNRSCVVVVALDEEPMRMAFLGDMVLLGLAGLGSFGGALGVGLLVQKGLSHTRGAVRP